MGTFRKIVGRIMLNMPMCIRRPYYLNKFGVYKINKQRKRRIEIIKNTGKVKVLFIVSYLAEWKLDKLLALMLKDRRFAVKIIAHPCFKSITRHSGQFNNPDVEQIMCYFKRNNINIINAFEANFDISTFIEQYNPDVLFYPMPYEDIYKNKLDYTNYLDRLLCYYPYAINVDGGEYILNTHFYNCAWKIYLQSNILKDLSRRVSYIKAKNVVVSGLIGSEILTNRNNNYPWKIDDKSVKRIIWAPHWSVSTGEMHNNYGFLWLSQTMLDIAELLKDRIQIVFKPHPVLKVTLYVHPEWGKSKTDAYYNLWKNGSNTMLEEGAYHDLFASSDALIHDSYSFMYEYLYTGKPVMYTTPDLDSIEKECNFIGKECLRLHYIAKTISEIETFIEETVCKGDDPLKKERETFLKNALSYQEDVNPETVMFKNLLHEFNWSING